MEAVSIYFLEQQKQWYIDQRYCAKTELAKWEEEYESLRRFKALVENSQSSFDATNQVRVMLIGSLEPYCQFNDCVKSYCDASSSVLNNIGAKTVGVAYTSLCGIISLKLKSYSDKIGTLDDKIYDCDNHIASLDRQINSLRMQGKGD